MLQRDGKRRILRAISMARCLACGSVRSFIQPCSSHSQMAPASSRMEIAQPSIVRKAGRFSLSISTLILLASRRGNPWVAPVVPAANTGLGFGIVGAEALPRVPPPCAQKRLGGELRLVSLAAGHHVRLKCLRIARGHRTAGGATPAEP